MLCPLPAGSAQSSDFWSDQENKDLDLQIEFWIWIDSIQGNQETNKQGTVLPKIFRQFDKQLNPHSLFFNILSKCEWNFFDFIDLLESFVRSSGIFSAFFSFIRNPYILTWNINFENVFSSNFWVLCQI